MAVGSRMFIGADATVPATTVKAADDRDDVEAPQGWDQELEDLRTDNPAYSSRNQGSGRT